MGTYCCCDTCWEIVYQIVVVFTSGYQVGQPNSANYGTHVNDYESMITNFATNNVVKVYGGIVHYRGTSSDSAWGTDPEELLKPDVMDQWPSDTDGNEFIYDRRDWDGGYPQSTHMDDVYDDIRVRAGVDPDRVEFVFVQGSVDPTQAVVEYEETADRICSLVAGVAIARHDTDNLNNWVKDCHQFVSTDDPNLCETPDPLETTITITEHSCP